MKTSIIHIFKSNIFVQNVHSDMLKALLKKLQTFFFAIGPVIFLFQVRKKSIRFFFYIKVFPQKVLLDRQIEN